MRNRDGALRWLWALGAGLLAFAVGALPAYRSYLHARNAIEHEFYQTLLNTALAAATTVDPELHKTFRPGEETTEKYRRAIEPLAKNSGDEPENQVHLYLHAQRRQNLLRAGRYAPWRP